MRILPALIGVLCLLLLIKAGEIWHGLTNTEFPLVGKAVAAGKADKSGEGTDAKVKQKAMDSPAPSQGAVPPGGPVIAAIDPSKARLLTRSLASRRNVTETRYRQISDRLGK